MNTLFVFLAAFIKRLLVKLGHVQAVVLLTVFYILFIVPIGILKSRRADLIGLKKRQHAKSFWTKRNVNVDLDRFSKRQY